ncbi:MAG: ABC transporter ATP-binding protein [Bacteroidetes bacterium]|nr:MAG: ABC transporter ATP-binding protein [Bacteroidota bacterium]
MSDIAIKLENISKQYRLGVVGTGTLSHDLNRWFARVRGKEDPTLKIGQSNQLSQAGGDYIWALKDINLEVKKGEILGIIGKNGAGKSTLLKLLSRVTGPTTGQIKVNGRIASLLEVGTGFHPELTGRENIFLNGAILGMRKWEIKKKLDEIVDFAGVAKYLDTPVKRYSSGMYVRLAFAVAAHLEPDILVVDEVLAVGDAEFQKKAIGKMQDVSKGGGRTVLFVSHNMALVQNLCPKSILLENGSVDLYSDTDIVIDNYLLSSKNQENRIQKSQFLKSIVLINSNSKETNKIKTRESFSLKFVFEDLKKIPFASIGVIIKNSKEQWVTSFTSDMQPIEFDKDRVKKEKISLFLENVPLNPGEYSVDVSISQKGDGRIEYLENIIYFDIIDSDIYKTGFRLSSYFGVFHLNGKWEIEK